ncbi:hypothetical protein FRX31_017952 [Thalictrum thalictroides]|uniref:Uncharacterized protein n=1 Tax=Thalictrum thalictroides TaxID=46969 RepID=A0A7J6W7G2_THATH|nr:hypothetical protein FRX31_017952 [Thalictrum thalictroides]
MNAGAVIRETHSYVAACCSCSGSTSKLGISMIVAAVEIDIYSLAVNSTKHHVEARPIHRYYTAATRPDTQQTSHMELHGGQLTGQIVSYTGM